MSCPYLFSRGHFPLVVVVSCAFFFHWDILQRVVEFTATSGLIVNRMLQVGVGVSRWYTQVLEELRIMKVIL